jgi:hypothetical protein
VARVLVVLSAGSLACGPAVAIDDERAPQCEASEPEYALRAEIADARLSALTELATGEVVAAGCLGREGGTWPAGVVGVDALGHETWRRDFAVIDIDGCFTEIVVDADPEETWLWVAPGSSRLHRVHGVLWELSGAAIKLAPPGDLEPGPIHGPGDPEGTGRLDTRDLAPRVDAGVVQVGRLELTNAPTSSAFVFAFDSVQREEWTFIADDPAIDLWWVDARFDVVACGSHCMRFDESGAVVWSVALEPSPDDPVVGFDRVLANTILAVTRSGEFLWITERSVARPGAIGCAELELPGGLHRVGSRFYAPCGEPDANAHICEISDSFDIHAVLEIDDASVESFHPFAGSEALWLLASNAALDSTSLRRLPPPAPLTASPRASESAVFGPARRRSVHRAR